MINALGQNAGKDVSVQINLNGAPMPDAFFVLSVKTHHGVNRIPMATVVIAGDEMGAYAFEGSEALSVAPGADIEIRAGYEARTSTIFKGVITRQGIHTSTAGSSVSLTCQDKAASLNNARETTELHNKTDSDAIIALFNRFGLAATVTAPPETHPRALVNDETAWEYVLRRADTNGLVVTLKGGKATVAPPAFAPPEWSATYGDDILDLNIEMDGASQQSQISAQAWAPNSQTVIKAASAEPTLNKQGNLTGKSLSGTLSQGDVMLTTHAPLGKVELKTRADAALLRSRLSRFHGTVRVPGQSAIWPGDQIRLEGLGKRFNGDGYISGIEHNIANGDWTTTVTLGLDAQAFPAARQHPTHAPFCGGLQIAKVIKTDGDPQNQRRIKVTFPLNTNHEEGAWVRLASPYATANAGLEFLPEIGDEIVVGFMGGDPDGAVMIGALHSSAHPAPVEPDETNSMKTIVSRSNLKLSFDDDNKAIQLETPGGHVVTMSDREKAVTVADSTGNRFSMTENGIEITSPKDVTITAGGRLSLSGTTGATVASPTDVRLSGATATVEADTDATVTGGASSTLKSSGQTVISGSMVMIN